MKRPHPQKPATAEFRSVKQDVSTEQLAAIGSVVLNYNYAESAINRMLAPALGLTVDVYHAVTSRINGLDGKIEIVKIAAAGMGMPEDMRLFLAEGLGEAGFSQFKKYRDAIIHARIQDPALGYGEVVESRGRLVQVLLTAEALNILADHLDALSQELACFILLFMKIREVYNEPIQDTEPFAREILDLFARAKRHRKNRQFLPPLPKFPEESAG
ncbi:hypothetical protein [Bradyrhizobium sp. DASA03120]|uniref:hypothetical protein n=1 Tax=Bradyrhizobium sp. SMVTL-02 TaxID=3395917 RepID=UPI003F6EEFEC